MLSFHSRVGLALSGLDLEDLQLRPCAQGRVRPTSGLRHTAGKRQAFRLPSKLASRDGCHPGLFSQCPTCSQPQLQCASRGLCPPARDCLLVLTPLSHFWAAIVSIPCPRLSDDTSTFLEPPPDSCDREPAPNVQNCLVCFPTDDGFLGQRLWTILHLPWAHRRHRRLQGKQMRPTSHIQRPFAPGLSSKMQREYLTVASICQLG